MDSDIVKRLRILFVYGNSVKCLRGIYMCIVIV